jgi:Tfp pilus assembly protein PilN
MHVNLLPDSFQWRMRLRTGLRQWLLAWGVLTCLALSVGLWRYRHLPALRTELAALEEQARPLRELETETAEHAARLAAIKLESEKLQDFSQERQVLGLIGLVAQCATERGGSVQVQRFGFQARPLERKDAQAPATPPAPDDKSKPRETASLQLHGVGNDDGEVARFVSGLQASRVFEKVDLKSCSDLSGSNGGRQFHIECRF